MIEFGIGFVVLRVIVFIAHQFSEGDSSPPVPVKIPPPEKIITLVGPTGARKSSTANALLQNSTFEVGATHGTTSTINETGYRNGYILKDTPGLLDNIDYKSKVLQSLKNTELVIYTTSGQLYRQEIEILKEILQHQVKWNKQSTSVTPSRKTIVYINMEDIRDHNMPKVDAENIRKTILEQLEGIISKDQITFGASAPMLDGINQKPQIEKLNYLITKNLN